jgi:hypothetical protein
MISFIALALLWLGAIAALIVASLRQRPWEWSFGIRDLMILTTIVAVICGVVGVIRQVLLLMVD